MLRPVEPLFTLRAATLGAAWEIDKIFLLSVGRALNTPDPHIGWMTYRKGARAERELAELLWSYGAAVIRSAGSGNMYAPDVVAVFRGTVYAFECKAWKRSVLTIPTSQMEKMMEWMRRSGARLFVAWKVPYRGWLFLQPSALLPGERNYRIDIKTAEKLSIPLEVLFGIQRTVL